MEHLTRNTKNDRLIYTIENIKKENEKIVNKDIKQLIDKIANVATGIISSIISACIVSVVKKELIVRVGTIFTLLIILVIFLGFWFLIGEFIIPCFNKLLCRKYVDISPETKIKAVRRFNTEIMQMVAEITEIIEVIKTTEEIQCKTLNYVLSLYKLQEITNFLYTKFASEKVALRRNQNDGNTELLRCSFNIYTVSAVLETVNNIVREMKSLSEEDEVIKNIQGIDLLKMDLENIHQKLEKIEIPYSIS